MFVVEFLARLISVLRAAATPGQIGAGFVLGMAMGFTPSTVISVLIVLVLIVFNVNITAALFASALCRVAAYLFDPLFHSLGYFLLAGISGLRPLWTLMYNTAFVPFTGFNNSVVMGGGAISLLLALPAYLGVRHGVIVYRERYDERVRNSKVVRVIQASALYKWYHVLRRIGDRLW